MTLRRRRALAWLAIALAVAGAVAWLARADLGRVITTDVLDLVPEDERNVELSVVRELASRAEGGVMLVALREAAGAAPPLATAQAFVTRLREEPGIADAIALADPAWREAMGRALLPARFTLLFPAWLESQAGRPRREDETLPAAVARHAVADLSAFLEQPEAVGWQEVIPADPLLLLPSLVDDLARRRGLLPGERAQPGHVWVRLAVSPLEESGQAPVFAAIARAVEEVRSASPGLRAEYAGVNVFAAASRARIEREVAWLNGASLVAVLAVVWFFLRRVQRTLHLVPVIVLALLGAWVAVTAAFDRVHIIVFVVGSLLTGVAIDYAFYLYLQPPLSPEESYGAKVRRLLKPLVASCLTTVFGFALLLASDLPMIRHLGVFVGVGLLCALGGALVYFSTFRQAYLAPRGGGGGWPALERAGGRWRRAGLVLWVVVAAGLLRLEWRDDIRDLAVAAPALRETDARLRAEFGAGGERTVYVSTGRTLAEARSAVAGLRSWLRDTGVADERVASVAPLVPTAAQLERARAFQRDAEAFAASMGSELEAAGFEREMLAPFFAAWRGYAADPAATTYPAIADAARGALAGPASLLLHAEGGLNWFVTVVRGAAPPEAPPASTSSFSSRQLESLNRLFARYRTSALRLSAVGLAVLGLGVLLTYGGRAGLRIFAVPAGTCVAFLGACGWLGLPLNLFHLFGAFLGVCLTHNYSIFAATSAFAGEPVPVSVRLSALTTAASFAVLACSSIPVVSALGLTVCAMVLGAWLTLESGLLGPLRRGA